MNCSQGSVLVVLIPNSEALLRIAARLLALDFFWFKSVYFRKPASLRADEIRWTPSGPSPAENRASQSRLASASLRLCIAQEFLASFSCSCSHLRQGYGGQASSSFYSCSPRKISPLPPFRNGRLVFSRSLTRGIRRSFASTARRNGMR